MSQVDLAPHQAQHDTLQTKQLDVCYAHAGHGDDCHYHAKPSCIIAQMENAGDDAIIGWAFDDFTTRTVTNGGKLHTGKYFRMPGSSLS